MSESTFVAKCVLSRAGSLRLFMSAQQRLALVQGLKGEEKEGIAELVNKNAEVVEKMPKIYEQDGLGQDAVAHLHYFFGSNDWYITEKDMGDDGDFTQYQAFGLACLSVGPEGGELGYISIQELIDNNIELDLYWEPKTLKEIGL